MLQTWLRGPRQLRLFFLAVMLLLAFTLGLLGWRLLEQEQQLAASRLLDQRETAAELTATALEKRLSTVEQNLGRMLLDGAAAKPPAPAEGAVFVQMTPGSIRAWPDDGLIYYPDLPEAPDVASAVFDTADELEFRKSDYAAAIYASRKVFETNAGMSNIQAAALNRIARNYRKNGQLRESLHAYAQLSALGATPVDGMSAGLAGDAGVVRVQEDAKDNAALAAASETLMRDLNSARWPITYATYMSLLMEARRHLPEGKRAPTPRTALAEAVQSMWDRWNKDSTALASGRMSLDTAAGPVLIVWQASGNAMAGFAANTGYIEGQWLAEMRPQLESHKARLMLTDQNGRVVLGNGPSSDSRAAIRALSATGLPWNVEASNTSNQDPAPGVRRRLLVFGGVLATLILTGSWFVGHAVARELAVARLQSDFISVVSHEFRTPLTTLCQLSELLKRKRVASESDRQQYYEMLNNESQRLRRLVESLLDFGRLESGRMQFQFEQIDAAELVRQVLAEFGESRQALGHRFEVDAGPQASMVHADRETLRCVFWNLFENAVKYSPDCDTVWVKLANNSQQVEIAVRDQGVGIRRAEQERIFEKFVRGSDARASGIRGTGIGLAMARQIVRAHHGDILLESEPGKGSTFRVVMPLGNGNGNGNPL